MVRFERARKNIYPIVEAVGMWESRRNFKRVWEGWEPGIMAFHAFHTLSFPRSAFRPAILGEPVRHPVRLRLHQRSGAAFPRRDRSTKSAASSASLRSVLRGVPIRARMVRPRAKSVTWIARAATGKSGGMSPALI